MIARKHSAAALTALLTGLIAAPAAAEPPLAEPWVVSGDLGAAALLGQPQRSLFGPGISGSLAIHHALPLVRPGWQVWRPRLLVGLRLRGGVFSDVAAQDITRRDPGNGGLAALLLSARVRPLARADEPSRAGGPWIELGAGGGLTGDLGRAMGELGVGWGFALRGLVVGPMLRYHHVVQPGSGSDGNDGLVALAGLEVAWSGPVRYPAPPAAPPPPIVAKAEPAPDKDSDGDGILDKDDACPSEAEDQDGFEDGDGCPEPDNDRDGILDALDKCPNAAEVVNGVDDGDGCPDEGLIVMVDDRVVLEEEVLFKTDRARVTSRGRRALVAVMRLWKQHPEWERLEVEGHADYRGPDRWNQQLSEERARRVRKVLIELGLDAGIVSSVGFGNTRPRTPGRDDESLQRNRRVELVVTHKRPAQTGKDAAPGGSLAPAPMAPEPPMPAQPMPGKDAR